MKFSARIYAVVAALLLCVSVSSEARRDDGAYIVEAVAKYDAGDFAQAESILRKVLEDDPGNDAALYYMAMCSLASQKTRQAEGFLIKAIEADTTNYWYRHRLASIYAMTRRPQLTIAIYEKLLLDFPRKNELYFELVELYAATGQNEKALNTLKEVETVFGMTESIAVYRYNLLLKTGNKEEAYRSLEEYNSRYSSPFVLSALAEHQLSMHNDSTALAYYDEALEMAPDFAPALVGKAETFRMTRKYDAYFKALQEYMSVQEENPDAKSDYLSQLVGRSDPRFVIMFDVRIKSIYEDLVKLHPQSLSVAKGYGEYLMYTGRWEELSREGRDAYGKFPDELSFLEMAGVGDYNLKAYDKVLEMCDHVLEKAPSDSARALRAWSTKGDVYHASGEPRKAYKAYEKALNISPDYAYVLNNYAYYLSLEGRNLKKAYQMSFRTIEAEPDNATYLDTFGWILYLMGKPDEAKTHFKRAMLYGGNDSVVILDHYAEVLFALGEYDRAMVYWNKALSKNKGEIIDLEERINMRKQQMNRNK